MCLPITIKSYFFKKLEGALDSKSDFEAVLYKGSFKFAMGRGRYGEGWGREERGGKGPSGDGPTVPCDGAMRVMALQRHVDLDLAVCSSACLAALGEAAILSDHLSLCICLRCGATWQTAWGLLLIYLLGKTLNANFECSVTVAKNDIYTEHY